MAARAFAPLPLLTPSTSPAETRATPEPQASGSSQKGSQVRSSRRARTHPGLNISTVESAEHVALVHRIVTILSNPVACSKVTTIAFERCATEIRRPGEAVRKELPLSCMPVVLEMLQIPSEHLPILKGVLRREMHFEAKVDHINFEMFQILLTKVLRRIRDLYCLHFSRDQFVTRSSRRLEDDYVRVGSCGSGNFGQCAWVVHKVTRKTRVVKQIAKEHLGMPKEEIEQELEMLKRLDHPHIVRFFEWFESENSFLLVLEAAHGGDLDKALRRERESGSGFGLPEKMVKPLCEQALRALVYIHVQHVIHRDLKPANMILTQVDKFPPHLCLADFGIADVFGSGGCVQSAKKGTWAYMAPEIFNDEVSPKSDLWALGVVTYELLVGKRPFGLNCFEVHSALCCDTSPVDLLPVQEAGASAAAVKFIARLLTKEERLRPTAQQAEGYIQEWLNDELSPEAPNGSNTLRRSLTKSINEFQKRSTFSKAALLCVASQLDTSTMEKMNGMFTSLDTDHDGELSILEFTEGFRKIGFKPDEIDSIVDSLDINRSGNVEYSEFVAGCLGARTELLDSALFHAFSVFDVNRDGVISLDELRSICGGGDDDGTAVSISELLPDGETLEGVLTEQGALQDGVISYAEFRAYLEKENNIGGKPHRDSGDQDSPDNKGSQPYPATLASPPQSVPHVITTTTPEMRAKLDMCLDLSRANSSLVQELLSLQTSRRGCDGVDANALKAQG